MLLLTCRTSLGVAVAAADVGNAQVARIDEPDELGRFVIQQRVGPDRVARGSPGVGKPGPDVGLPAGRRLRVAAVAIDAAEPDGLGLAVRLVLSLMAREAARALGGGLPGVCRDRSRFASSGGIGNGTVAGPGPAGLARRSRRRYLRRRLRHRFLTVVSARSPQKDRQQDENRQRQRLARSQAL